MSAETFEGSPLDLRLSKILEKVSNVERMTDRLEASIYNIGFAEGRNKAVKEFAERLKQVMIADWKKGAPTPTLDLIDKIGKEIMGDEI